MAFCELAGVPCEEMARWLCHTKFKTSTDTYVRPVSAPSAVSGRDALAKHIYARLFGWMVDRVNGALRSAANRHSFIGVLDIYGYRFPVPVLSACFWAGRLELKPVCFSPGLKCSTSTASNSFVSTTPTKSCSSSSTW